MKGAATRAAIRAKGSWARSRLPARGGRLSGETGARPAFAALADWPHWLALPDEERQRIGAVAALLDAREALEGEIDGAALRGYAEVVGDAALEAVVSADDRGTAPLPAPGSLPRLSANLLAASLAEDTALLAQVTPQHDPAAAALVRRAEDLCRRIPAR